MRDFSSLCYDSPLWYQAMFHTAVTGKIYPNIFREYYWRSLLFPVQNWSYTEVVNAIFTLPNEHTYGDGL